MQEYFIKYSKRFLLGLIICLLIVVVCLVVGGMIGYGMSSEQNVFNVFNPDVWQHIMSFGDL